MINRLLKLLPILVLSLMPCLTGCSTSWLNVDMAKAFGMGSKLQQEAANNPVVQLIPVWTEAEGPGVDNQMVTRGFGGQIYFITEQRGLPSEVKGSVRIYLFDDQGTEAEQTKPIYQFDFDADAWQLHAMKTKLGPAYSVFIPYTRKGRNLANCALRIRYTPPTGAAMFSQMATLTLGGTKRPDSDSVESVGDDVTVPGKSSSKSSTGKSDSGDVAKRSKKMQITQVANEEPWQTATKSRTKSDLPTKSALRNASFGSIDEDEEDDHAELRHRIQQAVHDTDDDEEPAVAPRKQRKKVSRTEDDELEVAPRKQRQKALKPEDDESAAAPANPRKKASKSRGDDDSVNPFADLPEKESSVRTYSIQMQDE
jgi:hypothetical protein